MQNLVSMSLEKSKLLIYKYGFGNAALGPANGRLEMAEATSLHLSRCTSQESGMQRQPALADSLLNLREMLLLVQQMAA